MSKRFVVTILLLTLLAVSSWFIADDQKQVSAPQIKPTNKSDYWAEGLDFMEFDLLGNPKRRLITSRLVHFDDQSTTLANPRLTMFNPDQHPWLIDADTGWISPDGKLVHLNGRVIMAREGQGQTAPLRIVTSEVRVRPEQDYAETDRHLRVDRGKDWLESEGGQIWFKEPVRMRFLSRVKALYQANNSGTTTANQESK